MQDRLKRRTVYRGDDGGIWKTVRPSRDSVKVWKDETDDGVEATHVRVPISSTSEDRDGDEFTKEGLERMVEQLQAGDVPMFLDHGISAETGFQDYLALEAIGGWKDGEIEDGTVYGIGALDPDHEDAGTLAKRLENGVVPMGWSVGFIPRDTDPKTNDDGEQVGERFRDHDLLEVSSVGIPSNPDGVSASIAAAAKSFGRMRGVDVDGEAIARSITDELEKAIDEQSGEHFQLVADALGEYRELDRDVDDPLKDFVEWAAEHDDHDGDVVEAVATRYVAAMEDRDEDPGLRSWLDKQLDDVETNESDGDEDEDDEDDEEEEDSVESDADDDGGGQTITTDDVDAIASAVGDAVGRELESHRELLFETLDVETNESDEEDEEDDEEEEDSVDGVDSSTSSFTGDPRALSTFRSNSSDGDESGEKDTNGDGEENDDKTGVPAGPRFNPGHDN